MNSNELEQEILGEDARIRPDQRKVKDRFREWIEPILVFLVVLLLALVAGLLVIVGELGDTVDDVQTELDVSSTERDRGAANTCRLLNALGLDVGASESRCQDPEVIVGWEPYAGETTMAADAANTALIVACRIAAASSELVLPECVSIPVGNPQASTSQGDS